jgi:hypothetical protein
VEGLNVHLRDIIEKVLVIDVSYLLGLEVDNVDVGLGDVHNNYLTFVEHSKEVDDVGVLVLEEHLTISIHMNDALIGTGVNHPRENKSVVEGGGEAEDLCYLVLQDKLLVALEQHIFI